MMKEKRPTEGKCENTGQELKLNDTFKLTWSTVGRNERKKYKIKTIEKYNYS